MYFKTIKLYKNLLSILFSILLIIKTCFNELNIKFLI